MDPLKGTPPPGKFAATVTLGEKGQIVIPKGARDLFGIKPGDTVLLLADTERGIAIMKALNTLDGYRRQGDASLIVYDLRVNMLVVLSQKRA